MNDLEFILTNFRIDPKNITERDMKWIKNELIPHYEFYSQPFLPATTITLHTITKEVRTINNAEMLAALKAL